MKISLPIVALLFVVANQSQAKPAANFKPGPKVISITGLAPSTSNISANVFYTPDDKSIAEKKCIFPQDSWNFNGSDEMLTVPAKKKAGTYNVDFSLTATRDACQYHVSLIYFWMKDRRSFELINLVPQNLISQNQLNVPDIAASSPMYCDFKAVHSGFCSFDLEGTSFKFSTDSLQIKFDIKDESEKPAPPTESGSEDESPQ